MLVVLASIAILNYKNFSQLQVFHCCGDMVLRISVILFLLAYLKPSKQQEPPFQFKLITPSPDVDINLILVECFEVERGQGNPDAFIWLNGISLATLTRVDRLPQTRRFRFIITRDLEGNYTCGTQEDSVNRLQSKPERLVGKSNSNTPLSKINFFFDRLLCTRPLMHKFAAGAVHYNIMVEFLNFAIGLGCLVLVSCNQLLALPLLSTWVHINVDYSSARQ